MKKIKRPYYPPATDPGATPKASGGGHQDTHGGSRDPPSSPVQVKRASAEIAPSPERLAILPPSTTEMVPYRSPSEPPLSAVGGCSSASVADDQPNFDSGRDLKPRKVKVKMGPGHPDFHLSMASVVKNIPFVSSYLSASKKVQRRVQEHETGIEMHDLSKVVCGDRADRQAAMPVSSGTLLRNGGDQPKVAQFPSTAPSTALVAAAAPQCNYLEPYFKMEFSGKSLAKSELKVIKSQQRSVSRRSMWATEWAFPYQDPSEKGRDVLNTAACERAVEWNCHGVLGCQSGDCMAQVSALEVFKLRMHGQARIQPNGLGGSLHLHDIVLSDLVGCYDVTNQTWGKVHVRIDDFKSCCLCASAYGLCLGMIGSTFYDKVVSCIIKGNAVPLGSASAALLPRTKAEEAERRSHDFNMLSAYVRSLRNKHEMQPAPGAVTNRSSPGDITFMSKTTWREKWAACERYFRSSPDEYIPGSQSMLKRVWKVRAMIPDLNPFNPQQTQSSILSPSTTYPATKPLGVC